MVTNYLLDWYLHTQGWSFSNPRMITNPYPPEGSVLDGFNFHCPLKIWGGGKNKNKQLSISVRIRYLQGLNRQLVGQYLQGLNRYLVGHKGPFGYLLPDAVTHMSKLAAGVVTLQASFCSCCRSRNSYSCRHPFTPVVHLVIGTSGQCSSPSAFRRSTGTTIVNRYFHYSFLFSSPSQPFLIEGVLRSKNLSSKS